MTTRLFRGNGKIKTPAQSHGTRNLRPVVAPICAIVLLTIVALSATTVAGASTSATVSFAGSDTSTEGNWHGMYGTHGYSIANNSQSIAAYASFAVQNQSNYIWASSTTDTRALQKGSGAGRIAATWYGSTFSFEVNFTDGKIHRFALYAVDWDTSSRAETIQILDANTGLLLDTRNISQFHGGIYLLWSLGGHVKVKVTRTAGTNAVISAAFFGESPFITSDTHTQGNWRGLYGTDGSSIANNSQTLPAYVSFAVQNQLNYTWAASTTDPRALQTESGTGRVAATWYSSSNFDFDVNFKDGKTHRFAVYAVDWDTTSRAETIQILDANTGLLLDTRNISQFHGGIYLLWNLSGHIRVNVIRTAGANSVISGVFFGATITAPGPLTTSVSSVSFGDVKIGSSSTLSVTFTNSGSSNVAIFKVTLSGPGLTASGIPAGLIIAPSRTATLNVTFAPAATGTVTGSVSVVSNTSNSPASITVSATGVQPTHSATLTWTEATSTVVITGYNVYRGTVSGGPYTKLNSSLDATRTFTDTTVQAGQTYYYVVTAVDSSNVESTYSHQVAATIP